MGSAEIVTGAIESIYFGYTDVANPILFMEVNGVPVASSYTVQSVGNSVRYMFPRIVNGNIYVTAISQVYGSDLAAVTISVKVLVAN